MAPQLLRKLFPLAVLLLSGCFAGLLGRETGRVAIGSPGRYEAGFTVDPEKPLRFWTDLDVRFAGEARILYHIEAFEGGQRIGRLECDAFDVSAKVMSREISVNDTHSLRYLGRMEGRLDPPSSGHVTLVVTVEALGDFTAMEKMDLVLRQ